RHFETVRQAKDGRLLTISLSVSPVRNETGQIVGAAMIVRDMTAQRKSEEQLHRERERWRATLTSIGDAVIATDGQGRIVFMNPVAERLTGWPERQAAGQPLDDVFRIVNELTRQTVENPVTRVLREGQI